MQVQTKAYTRTAVLFGMAAGLTLGAMSSAQAQATVKVDGKWRSSLGAGFTNSTGNTRSISVSGNGDAVRATEQDKWALYGNVLYGKSQGLVSAHQARLGTRYDYNLSPFTFVFVGGEFEHDRVAGLTARNTGNTGFGYKFINTPDNTFNIFGGLNYTRDKYGAPRHVDGEDRMTYSYPSAVLGEESTHKMSPTVSARQRFAYLPTLTTGGSYRAQWDAGLAVAMTPYLNLNVGFNAKFNSDPGPNLKRTDTVLTTGIAFKFD